MDDADLGEELMLGMETGAPWPFFGERMCVWKVSHMMPYDAILGLYV